ncbi:MAG: sigma factor-like helix-turn-helix DNA-binding protein [Chitinophagaceae bacterium]
MIEGYKHVEIAELLTISEGTSKWHLSEARKIMKQLIKTW